MFLTTKLPYDQCDYPYMLFNICIFFIFPVCVCVCVLVKITFKKRFSFQTLHQILCNRPLILLEC